jgi:hypothetical protein
VIQLDATARYPYIRRGYRSQTIEECGDGWIPLTTNKGDGLTGIFCLSGFDSRRSVITVLKADCFFHVC